MVQTISWQYMRNTGQNFTAQDWCLKLPRETGMQLYIGMCISNRELRMGIGEKKKKNTLLINYQIIYKFLTILHLAARLASNIIYSRVERSNSDRPTFIFTWLYMLLEFRMVATSQLPSSFWEIRLISYFSGPWNIIMNRSNLFKVIY